MANHKSAIKRTKQNEEKRLRNKSVRTRVKNVTKDVLLTANSASKEEAIQKLSTAKSAIDKAAKKGVIHKNTAARKVARLTRHANSVGP